MNKLYTLIVWHNNTAPALNEDNLNAMSEALDAIDTRVVEIAGDVIEVVPRIQDYLAQAQALEEALELLSRNPPYIGANGNWYVFNTETLQYEDSGVDASITVSIADITMIAVNAQPYVTNTGTNTDPVFHLYIPRSPQGETGNGIDRIAKTATSGLVDTYTVYYTDGTTWTYTVTNGQSGSGSGDMNEADYDPTGDVKAAGGIIAYLVANYFDKQSIENKIGAVTIKTLAANATTISFTVPTTGNNLIEFWTSDGSNYTALDNSVSGTVTLTYEPSASARTVSCRIATVS